MKCLVEKGQVLRMVILFAFLSALVTVAGSPGVTASNLANSRLAMAITVTNNSGRDMHHIYLSPVDRDVWGPDLLNESVLRVGQTFTITEVSCEGNEIKVIAEDREGCFAYGVVSCSQAATGWTITSETPKDCGN